MGTDFGNYNNVAFKKLGKLLPRQLRQAGIERDVNAARILEVANQVLDEVMGSDTSKKSARAAVYKFKVLKIATTDASLKNQIYLKKNELIQNINARLGADSVKKIQVII